MKTALLLLSAAALTTNPAAAPQETCPAPTVSAGSVAPHVKRFDPLTLDLDKDSVAAAGRCEHPINSKGAGVAGRAAADHAINSKGTGSAGRAAADHAINSKGTGVAGRSSDPNASCGDARAVAPIRARPAPREALLGARCGLNASTDADEGCGDTVAKAEPLPSGQQMAINCKGTGAK